jgi:hypothetical protein
MKQKKEKIMAEPIKVHGRMECYTLRENSGIR